MHQYDHNVVKIRIDEIRNTQCAMKTTAMLWNYETRLSLDALPIRLKHYRDVVNYVSRQGSSRMRHLDRNIFNLYANDATPLRQFGDRDVVKLHEWKASGECANATVMLINYSQSRRSEISL